MGIEEQYEEQYVGPKQFKKKNTKKWCKGKPGREHKQVIVLDYKNRGYALNNGGVCGETNNWYPQKHRACYHHVICENCGKELRYKPKVCPDTGLDTGW